MRETSDRRFDWVAGLAVASGVGVMVPALCAFAVTLIVVAALLI